MTQSLNQIQAFLQSAWTQDVNSAYMVTYRIVPPSPPPAATTGKSNPISTATVEMYCTTWNVYFATTSRKPEKPTPNYANG